MLTRRSLIAAPLAAAACASMPASPEQQFLDRVIAAAGGEAALRSARVLAWTGQATVPAGDRTLILGVDTIVEPFTYARSETWLVSEGRSTTRTMEIDGDHGWATRDGERTVLPEAQTAHERQQYALYGLMRFVTLRDPRVTISVYGDDEPSIIAGFAWPGTRYSMLAPHPLAPRTLFSFDENYRLIAASNTVASPDADGAPVEQTFLFSGAIEGGGVRWPRRMRILRGGSLYFELTLDTFTPRRRR